MHRTYFIIIACIALASAILIFFSIWKENSDPEPVTQEQSISYPVPPFKSYITGVGIVEASSENIFIGLPIQRLVKQVLVKGGDKVKKGDVLIKLEDLDLQADLKTRQVEYEIALAKIQKLKQLPRPEDVSAAEANLRRAEAELAQARSQYEMVQGLQDSRAIRREEINRRQFNYEQTQALRQQAQVNLEKVKAGAWEPDIQIAHLEAEQAKANVDRVKADIERTIIRSPIDGKVLQIKIHEGELPPMDTFRTPIMVVGDTDEKYLVVSINQFNTPYFRPDAQAIAFLQGDTRIEFPLEFVRLEPYLVSKQNLTNLVNEKVDTRVLEVTYSFKNGDHQVFVGQQMDAFIEADMGNHHE
jgi:HlyD family secretion protein